MSDRPELRIGLDVEAMADDAIELLAREADIYQRAGKLVHVVRPPGPNGTIGAPVIRELERATLLERLSSIAVWKRKKVVEGEETWRSSSPPQPVVAAVAARGEWQGVKPLVGVIESPALRPCGCIIQEPGYDAATGYLYLPDSDYPAVSAEPTRDDAIRARDALLEVVADFPFERPEHRAAWFASALTLFARPAIDGCTPLVAIDSSTRGAGKGKLADATANLATGRDASKTPQPRDDEEMRKRITALVIEGERIALLDNVIRPIGDPSLDACLTATMWKDRALGKNETLSAPNLLVWFVTGNNLVFAGDTARRTIHIRLEPRVENPEDRGGWRHPDLLPWVRAERPRLVHAALTVLRGWFAAGKPDMGCKPWGSFESWTSIIANATRWVGLEDPQATRTQLEDSSDVAKQALRTLLERWESAFGQRPVKAATIHAAIYPANASQLDDNRSEVRDAIEALSGRDRLTSKQIGEVLRASKGRVIGGRKLDQHEVKTAVAQWVVRKAG